MDNNRQVYIFIEDFTLEYFTLNKNENVFFLQKIKSGTATEEGCLCEHIILTYDLNSTFWGRSIKSPLGVHMSYQMMTFCLW